jgi:hypothetical protein
MWQARLMQKQQHSLYEKTGDALLLKSPLKTAIKTLPCAS